MTLREFMVTQENNSFYYVEEFAQKSFMLNYGGIVKTDSFQIIDGKINSAFKGKHQHSIDFDYDDIELHTAADTKEGSYQIGDKILLVSYNYDKKSMIFNVAKKEDILLAHQTDEIFISVIHSDCDEFKNQRELLTTEEFNSKYVNVDVEED